MNLLYLVEHIALALLLTCILFAPAILTWSTQRRPTQALTALGFIALFAAFSAVGVYTWSQEDWSAITPKSGGDYVGAIALYLALTIGFLLIRNWQIARQPTMSADEIKLIRRDYRLRIILFTAAFLLALVSPRLAPPPDRSLVGGTTLFPGISSSATAPPALPTPALPPATLGATPRPGDVLYRADWSGGLGAWSASQDWSAQDGTLVNSGALPFITWHETESEAPTLLIPYHVGQVTDYAVIAEMQVTVDPSLPTSNLTASFGFLTSGSVHSALLPVWRGNRIGVLGSNTVAQQVSIWTDGHSSSPLGAATVHLGPTWHTYRVEVRGDRLSILVDGALICQATGAKVGTSDEWIGLWSANTPLTLRALSIVAL
jgi:hypothetical protein